MRTVVAAPAAVALATLVTLAPALARADEDDPSDRGQDGKHVVHWPDGQAHVCRVVDREAKGDKRVRKVRVVFDLKRDGSKRTGSVRMTGEGGDSKTVDVVLSDAKLLPHGRTRWDYRRADGHHCDALDVDRDGDWRLSKCDNAGEATSCAPAREEPGGFTDPATACINHVVQAYAHIPRAVESRQYLHAHVAGTIKPPRFTKELDNDLGSDNHFQGFQRLPSNLGSWAVASGDDGHVNASYLFFIHMGTQPAKGPWSIPTGNLVRVKGQEDVYRVPQEDRIEKVIKVSEGALWHVGGFQSWGNYLAVPLEIKGGTRSKIVFYDVSDPRQPKQLPVAINRTRSAGGAVAFTRLRNDHFIVGVLDDQVDFYYSKTKDLADGFEEGVRWNIETVRTASEDIDADFRQTFQSINFIPQCDGKLYLIGFSNDLSEVGDPWDWGTDWADLYRVEFPKGFSAKPVVTAVGEKRMDCEDQQCNFQGATGIYLAGPNHLAIYGAYNFIHDFAGFHFNEYFGR